MQAITLSDVYADPYMLPIAFLYNVLSERDQSANISHRKLPTFEQHRAFVNSHPYQCWYIICVDGEQVGSIYLTNPPKPSQAGNEIGISILKNYQGLGYGKEAIYALMKLHPQERFLANIAPGNVRSMALFEGMGFELVQYTLELRC
jgi:RimJ/RimL family protein N-acetyltransferase